MIKAYLFVFVMILVAVAGLSFGSYAFGAGLPTWIPLCLFIIGGFGLLGSFVVIPKLGRRGGGEPNEGMALLEAMFDQAPVEMYLKDRDGRYVQVNRRFEKLVGARQSEIAGNLPADVVPDSSIQAIRQHDLEVLETRKPITRESLVETALGPRELKLSKFPVFGDDGELLGLGAVLSDQTEMLQMSRRLSKTDRWIRAILENAPVGIYLKDGNGIYILANPTFCEILGVRQEDLIGRTVLAATGAPARPEQIRADEKIIETKESVVFDTREKSAAGERFLEVLKFPVLDEFGNVSGIGGIEVDITDRKKIERELMVAKEDAEMASRAKTDFLANMSHEIRTPLNAILGFSQVLETEVFGPIGSDRYKSYASDIHRSGTHLMELIGDILDLSKIESGHVDLLEETVVLADVIATSVSLLQAQADGKGIGLRVLSPIEGRVVGDSRAMRQILINLLSNAVKFTRSGGTVSVEVGESEDGGLVLNVIDTGIGIESGDLHRVLEPFTQLRTPHVQGESGSGIGLSIVDRLCDGMGYELQIESAVNEGTTVRVIVPPSHIAT